MIGTLVRLSKVFCAGGAAAFVLLLIADVAVYRVLRSRIPQSRAGSPGYPDTPRA